MKKIIDFYFRHKKLTLLIIAVLIGVAVYAMPDTAFAVDAPADNDPSSLTKKIGEGFEMILSVTSAWLWPVILMIGSLLDNDLIFGGEMGERLLGVWVQIRNLVNIIFVLVLLAIAIYNVLPGVGEEAGGMSLGLKTALPKFVLALIAVNFSFIAAKVVLDFTNVVTGAVFALPTIAVDEGNLSTQIKTTICGTESGEVPMRSLWCEQNDLNERGKAFFSKLDRQNITIAYAVRFGRAANLKFVKGGLKDLTQLAFNIIFNLVLYVVYAVSHIVLFIVLLFRVVVLWVGVVLSPLIALGIVLPSMEDLSGGAGKIKEQFVKNAIAPIKIGLVMSVGYIMLDGFQADKTIHGGILSGSTLVAIDPNALPTDINDLQQLMIAVAVVVIIWVGVFSAAEGTAAEGITGFIKTHMQDLGTWVAKLPTYATVIPVKGGEKRSLAQVFDKLDWQKEKWTQERSMAPERRGDVDFKVNKLKSASNPGDTAKAIRGNEEILALTSGINALAQKDDTLGSYLRNLNGNTSARAVAKAISGAAKAGSVYAKEIMGKYNGKEADLIREIETRKRLSESSEGQKEEGQDDKPAVTTDEFLARDPSAAADLLQKHGAAAAGKGSFAGWGADEITAFRNAMNAVADNKKHIFITLDSKGVAEKYNANQITAASNALADLGGAGDNEAGIRAAIQKAFAGGVPEPVLNQIIGALEGNAKDTAKRLFTEVKTSRTAGTAGSAGGTSGALSTR